MGPCAGGAVYSPAITDFTLMVDQTSHMFITGPDVIKTVTGEDVSMEELGGAHTHNSKSGNAHYLGVDEADAIDYVKALLSYLPQNNLEDPPAYDGSTYTDTELEVNDEDRALEPLWFAFVNRLLELSRGHDGAEILHAFEDAHHPALWVYAELERLVPVGQR